MEKSRYYFYENPHDEYAWTRCPKCGEKTKLRKFCLMVSHGQKLVGLPAVLPVRADCKFCTNCELVFKKKSEIEAYLRMMGQNFGIKLDPKSYFVFGTMDIADWKEGQKTPTPAKDAFEKLYVFKDVWKFDIRPAGWYFDDGK